MTAEDKNVGQPSAKTSSHLNSFSQTLKREGIHEEFLKEELPPNAVLQFDNDGNLVVKNRAYRRQKLSLVKGNTATTKKRTANKVKKDRKAERANRKKGRK